MTTDSLRECGERAVGTPVGDAQESLQLDAARLQAILDSAQDAILSIDGTGRITLFNRGAESMFGYRADEVMGHSIGVLMPPPYREEHDQYIRRYLEGGEARVIGRVREIYARRRNGEVFPIELSVSESRVGDTVAYTGIIRDITQRRQIDEALRRERDFAERLLETAQVIVLVLDTGGRIVRFNAYMEEISGYRLPEVQGHDWFATLLPPRDAQRLRDMFRQVISGVRIYHAINPILTKEGAEREIEWNSKTLTDASGAVVGVLAIGQDITERLHAERRLAAQFKVTRILAEAPSLAEATEPLLQAICEAIGWEMGELWHVDRDANLLRWDGAWHAPGLAVAGFVAMSRTHTFTRGSGLPGHVWATGRPASVTDLMQSEDVLRSATAAAAGLCAAFAFPIFRRELSGVMMFFSRDRRSPQDDTLRLLDALGRQVGGLIERKQADQALRESEARFRTMADSAPVLIWVAAAEGGCVFFNQGWLQFTGRRLEQEVGEGWSENVHPEDRQRVLATLRRAFAARQPFEMEFRLRRADGEYRWLLDQGTPRTRPDGSFAGYVGSAVDITERIRAEAELREMQKLHQQRDRLADIGAITAKIVHDLGNPLAGLSMQAQLILRRARRDGAQALSTAINPAEQILAEVRRLESLINEFRDFSREQRLEIGRVDVADFLQGLVGLWAPVAAGRGITLSLELSEPLPPLSADVEKLRRVLDNLVKNAVEAVDHGPGTVRVQAGVLSPAKLRISVADTGPGIPQTVEVFRLFETTKAHGSGLGLAIAKEIILAHGGGIHFAQLSPHGTVFHVDLPYAGETMRRDPSPAG